MLIYANIFTIDYATAYIKTKPQAIVKYSKQGLSLKPLFSTSEMWYFCCFRLAKIDTCVSNFKWAVVQSKQDTKMMTIFLYPLTICT